MSEKYVVQCPLCGLDTLVDDREEQHMREESRNATLGAAARAAIGDIVRAMQSVRYHADVQERKERSRMLTSEPGTLTYALTQSRLARQALERGERKYEPGLYRRYVAGEGISDGSTHWCEYDEDVQAERAVAAWERVEAVIQAEYADAEYLRGWIRDIEDTTGWPCPNDPALNVLRAVATVLEEKRE